MPETAWRAVLAVLAAAHVVPAAWAAVNPAGFANELAPFGSLNRHLIDDYAAASAAFGIAFALTAIRRQWRVPLLTIATLWTALHAVSHIAAAESTRETAGPIEAAILVATTALLVCLVWAAARET